MKKILLTGTTSSGKSTMWQFLKDQPLKNIIFIEEIARELLLKYPGIEQDPAFQTLLFAEQVKREQEAAEQEPELLICDRGSVDIVAHAHLFGQAVQPEWYDWSQTYDYALYFEMHDISFETTDLQKRISKQRDWQTFRVQLDEHIRAALRQSCLPYHMISGTHEERQQKVEQTLWPHRKHHS